MKNSYNDNALDVFRILATVQVFLGHIITHFSLPQLTEAVYFVRGVPILFALCGFLAAKSLDRSSAKEFYIRRAVRIFPGFWSCILINSLIILLLYNVTPTLIQAIIYLITQICGLNFYTGEWLRGYGVGTPNGVLWTIGTQLQFFLIAPFFNRLLMKLRLQKSSLLIVALTAMSIGLKNLSGFLPEILSKLIQITVVPYLYFLVLGMAVWRFREQVIPTLKQYRWFILLAYIVWKAAENHLQFPHFFDGVMYNTITTLLICMVIFAFAFTFKWRMRKDLTYGFYLYHMVFVNVAVHLGYTTMRFDLQSLVIFILIIGLTILFSWASQKFIENPVARQIERKSGV